MTHIFQGELIRLRAVEADDWKFFQKMDDSTTDFGRNTHEITFPTSQLAKKEWTQQQARDYGKNDCFRFVIVTHHTNEFVGTINTHSTDKRIGTFGYGLGIATEHQRKGYAREAIMLVLSYFFKEKRYQKVNASVYSFNTPSMSLHKNLGFELEGRLRRTVYTDGQFYDMLIYGMTREEFEAMN